MRAKWSSKCAVIFGLGCATVMVGGSPAEDSKSLASHAPAPLISRDRVALNLAGAEMIIAAAKARAAELYANENIAVVDDGGHLLAFARMDKARPASISTALTKAVAAATTRQATGPVRRGEAEPDLLLNLSLQSASAMSGGKMTSLKGGIPIVVDGQVIGAVGVGGGTGEQDADVAQAAIERFLQELRIVREH
jgi:glc operon protein GlcG